MATEEPNKAEVGSEMPGLHLSAAAQEYYNKHFVPRLHALRERSMQEKLSICILGPGTHSEWHGKRIKVAQRLTDHPVACVPFFIEYAITASDPLLGIGSLTEKERQYLQAAELIIVMDLGSGVCGEIHDFARDLELGAKMHILIPNWCQDGYTFHSVLKDSHATVHVFDMEELKRCRLVDRCCDVAIIEKQLKYHMRLLVESAGKRYTF